MTTTVDIKGRTYTIQAEEFRGETRPHLYNSRGQFSGVLVQFSNGQRAILGRPGSWTIRDERAALAALAA
jgi:hypothetical protein